MFDSLNRQSFRNFDIHFIDNDSRDGSPEYVREHFPSVRLTVQARNDGYARAGNLGVRQAQSEYVIILNTDLRLDPGCLEELVKVADSDPAIAAVASKMLLYHDPGVLNGVGGSMNYLGYTWDRGMFEKDRGQYDHSDEVLFACGGAALFRRSSFLSAGGFDRRFFMYHEDVDLCWRSWILGYRVVTAPRARVFHRFSASTREEQGMRWRELIGERNNIRALIKNYEIKHLYPALRDLLQLPQQSERKAQQWKNLRWNLLALPDTLWHRIRIQWRRTRSDRDMQHLIESCREVPIETATFEQRRVRRSAETPREADVLS